jgi:hypothetical protein
VKFVLPAVLLALLAVAPACGKARAARSDTPLPSADGVITSVTGTEISLLTGDGSEVAFALRPIDARRIDLVHLQLHARDQLPSRVFYERQGTHVYAVRVDDL